MEMENTVFDETLFVELLMLDISVNKKKTINYCIQFIIKHYHRTPDGQH